MNKLFLSFAALFVSLSAFATSPVGSILECRQTDAGVRAGTSMLKLQRLNVYLNGRVVAEIEQGDSIRYVGTITLNTHQMDEILELAKVAHDGKVRKVAPGVACFVASPYLHNYTSENKTVTLYKGHQCNGPLLVNDSKATKRLLTIVNNLRAQLFRK